MYSKSEFYIELRICKIKLCKVLANNYKYIYFEIQDLILVILAKIIIADPSETTEDKECGSKVMATCLSHCIHQNYFSYNTVAIFNASSSLMILKRQTQDCMLMLVLHLISNMVPNLNDTVILTIGARL